jgi:hypothetical protein
MFKNLFVTNYDKEANQLLIKLAGAVSVLRDIRNSNSTNVSALRIKYNTASNTIKSIQTRVETLKNKFKSQIEKKNPKVESLPTSAKNYISSSSNGTKFIITRVPTIKTMGIIIKNFGTAKSIAKNKAAANAMKRATETAQTANKNKKELELIKKGASKMLNTAAETQRRINVENAVRSQLGTTGNGGASFNLTAVN